VALTDAVLAAEPLAFGAGAGIAGAQQIEASTDIAAAAEPVEPTTATSPPPLQVELTEVAADEPLPVQMETQAVAFQVAEVEDDEPSTVDSSSARLLDGDLDTRDALGDFDFND
jgi:hypothetical protein